MIVSVTDERKHDCLAVKYSLDGYWWKPDSFGRLGLRLSGFV